MRIIFSLTFEVAPQKSCSCSRKAACWEADAGSRDTSVGVSSGDQQGSGSNGSLAGGPGDSEG